ncbi:hypothetical protein C0992_002413 [Termitomyces sp. T32_za158]|nr:hypothetical protein C0992_002413 [Termitomyces sp. T32_za158]
MTDTDDSIVIDDLVRTAEASRLRRRGALRLDHHHHYPHPPAIISFDDDEDDDYDDHDEEYIPGLHHIRRQPALEYKYSLFCGGDVPSPTDSTPFTPSILPLAPPSGPPLPPLPKQRTTNGCGALVHAAAAPRRRPSSAAHTWYAPPGAGASATLVPLDPAYIDDPAPLRLHCAPCGCVREALACAVCGNLLGTRFAPCPIDTHSYARAFPSAADTCAYSYSLLPAAVSSSPAYSPPSSPPTPAPAPPARAASSTPPPLLDRFITASPTPLTDEERTAYYRARPSWGSATGIGYTYAQLRSSFRNGGLGARTVAPPERVPDPDAGDLDGDEAASDKTGEGVFLPDR